MSENFDFELAKLLRDQVPNDESIHSTLLRTLLAHDPNIKPIGVISDFGRWIDNPFVHKGYEHLFYRNPDHLLLETIDMNLSVNGKGNSLFDNPAVYTYRIESTFFSGRTTRRRARGLNKVRYCLSCIKESIDSVGYGYFRHFWDYSNECLIHGQPLNVLPDLGFSKTLKALKKLLNAKDCKQAIVLAAINSGDHRFSCKLPRDKTERYLFPIKLAPGCLMLLFAKWVHNNSSKFEDAALRHFAKDVSGQYLGYYHSVDECDYRQDFASIFMFYAEYEPELLNSFMTNNVSLVGLELGPRKQGVIREIFAKHTASECSTCNQKSCIMKTHQGTFSVDATELNFEYLLENSYTLARVSMQGRPIRVTRDSIWGAIDVFPEVTDSTIFNCTSSNF